MISLCMIVKNEQHYLPDCLRSVKGVADEIIVVDTGSTDLSVKIAEEYGAKIYFYKWNGDFSAARNYSLQQATGRWILYLDADERLNSESINQIKKFADGEPAGYRCNVISIDEVNNHPSVMSYVRFFSAGKDIIFEGKVHEQIEPALVRNNYPILNSSIGITHLGYNISKDILKKKAERNLQILIDEYNSNPSGYYAFQLAQTYGILDNKIRAEEYFSIALKDSQLKKEYRGVAHRYIAINLAERFRIQEALNEIECSIREDDTQPLSLMAAAKIYAKLNSSIKASEYARKAFQFNKDFLENRLTSFQNIMMDESELISHGLDVAVSISDKDLFNFFYQKLQAGSIDGEYLLFNDLFNKADIPINRADEFIKQMKKHHLEPLLRLLESYNNPQLKYAVLKMLQEKFSEDAGVRILKGKTETAMGEYADAEKSFEAAIKINPSDPSSYFYLLSVYLQTGNTQKLSLLLNSAETKFECHPEINSRLKLLKSKLAAHFK